MKTTRDYILETLKTFPNGRNFKEIQSDLGIMRGFEPSYDTVHNSLKRLIKAGNVGKISTNYSETLYFIGTKVKAGPAISFDNIKVVTPVTAPVPPPEKQRLTRVILLLDNSGSMSNISRAAKKAFDQALVDIKNNAAKTKEATTVSVYKFGSNITPLCKTVDSDRVNDIGDYYPNEGSTRIFDAVEQAVRDHQYDFRDETQFDTSYLVITITDGDDNASRIYRETFKQLLADKQKTDRWTFSFMLPRGYKNSFCAKWAVPTGNVTEWEQTEIGVAHAAQVNNAAFNSYFTARSSGLKSVQDFYVVNANDIKRTDLNKLTDVSGQCKTWIVDAETDIKTFVESKKGIGSYRPGTLYYQLTKSEKVQSYKDILVQEKFTKPIYFGAEARRLLALPEHDDCKVKPGNLGNFDIFIQSTSNNRKLVRGTRVIYKP